MYYLGGKIKIAKLLAARIRELEPGATWYWDPFCGGLSVSLALQAYAPTLASDANVALIAMYLAIRAGWQPPESVSEEEYRTARALPDSDPRKAFCAIACSFSGKWFGGYARSGARNYARNAHRNLRKVPQISEIAQSDWLTVEPRDLGACVLYLDPPYAGTVGYPGASRFEYDRFVQRVGQWARFAPVFVSEYDFPLGTVVWEREQTTTVARDKSKYARATERLYYLPKAT